MLENMWDIVVQLAGDIDSVVSQGFAPNSLPSMLKRSRKSASIPGIQ